MDINTKTATQILQDIRDALCERKPPEEIEQMLKDVYDIDPIRKCEGEAHANPFIDNCMVCAPRWGFAGVHVLVRARMPNKISTSSFTPPPHANAEAHAK